MRQPGVNLTGDSRTGEFRWPAQSGPGKTVSPFRDSNLPVGPWKPILDEISREERGSGRPDLTYLVIGKRSGLPGQMGCRSTRISLRLSRQSWAARCNLDQVASTLD